LGEVSDIEILGDSSLLLIVGPSIKYNLGVLTLVDNGVVVKSIGMPVVWVFS